MPVARDFSQFSNSTADGTENQPADVDERFEFPNSGDLLVTLFCNASAEPNAALQNSDPESPKVNKHRQLPKRLNL
jgi:hypothetical protein